MFWQLMMILNKALENKIAWKRGGNFACLFVQIVVKYSLLLVPYADCQKNGAGMQFPAHLYILVCSQEDSLLLGMPVLEWRWHGAQTSMLRVMR